MSAPRGLAFVLRGLGVSVLTVVLCATLRAQGSRLAIARVELAGPRSAFEFDGPGGRTRVAIRLEAGERRLLEVPVALAPGAQGALPDLDLPEGAAWLAWVRTEAAWADLPAGLRARSRPPAPGATPRLGRATRLWGGALLLLLIWLRRRPLAVVCIGTLGAGVVLLSARAELPPGPEVLRVLEGVVPDGGASPSWARVDVAQGLLRWAAAPCDLVAEPVDVPLLFEVSADSLPERWTVSASGATLWRRAAIRPGLRPLVPELNAWGPLVEVWERASDGAWAAHGAWAFGAPLGPPQAGGLAPPAWLAAGLPQGVRVLVGRLGGDAWRGTAEGEDTVEGTPEVATWLRLVGFGS